MVINYTLNWTDATLKPPFTLLSKAINTEDTSLTLTGSTSVKWGEPLQENLLKLLENFASNGVPPLHPTIGQLWYDVKTNKIKLYTVSLTWEDVVTLGVPRPIVTLPPTQAPTSGPTAAPTSGPTAAPTSGPTAAPTSGPTAAPTSGPTAEPTPAPTAEPTPAPTAEPEDLSWDETIITNTGNGLSLEENLLIFTDMGLAIVMTGELITTVIHHQTR